MAWEKRPIDKLDMMHLLGLIYAQTAVGFKKLGLQTLIEENARPSVSSKRSSITKAILDSGILLQRGYGRSLEYKWNIKCGVPSIPMAEKLISMAENQRSIERRKKWERDKSIVGARSSTSHHLRKESSDMTMEHITGEGCNQLLAG